MTTTPRGRRSCLVTLERPVRGPSALGYVEAWTALTPPTRFAAIEATPTERTLERSTGGTVTAIATSTITLDYHPQLTQQTRVTWHGRTFSIVGVVDPGEAHVTQILTCVEVAP
jgi:head-tail adaptor